MNKIRKATTVNMLIFALVIMVVLIIAGVDFNPGLATQQITFLIDKLQRLQSVDGIVNSYKRTVN